MAAFHARADEHAGHAAAEATIVAGERHFFWRHRRERRCDVIVEAAPLVVIDDDQRAFPLRAFLQRLVNLVQKGLPVAHVGVRVIVHRDRATFVEERVGIHDHVFLSVRVQKDGMD